MISCISKFNFSIIGDTCNLDGPRRRQRARSPSALPRQSRKQRSPEVRSRYLFTSENWKRISKGGANWWVWIHMKLQVEMRGNQQNQKRVNVTWMFWDIKYRTKRHRWRCRNRWQETHILSTPPKKVFINYKSWQIDWWWLMYTKMHYICKILLRNLSETSVKHAAVQSDTMKCKLSKHNQTQNVQHTINTITTKAAKPLLRSGHFA